MHVTCIQLCHQFWEFRLTGSLNLHSERAPYLLSDLRSSTNITPALFPLGATENRVTNVPVVHSTHLLWGNNASYFRFFMNYGHIHNLSEDFYLQVR